MTLRDELADMAERLGAAGWKRKLQQEWTPAERRAYEEATDEEINEWTQWWMDEPLECQYRFVEIDGEEVPHRGPQCSTVKGASLGCPG